MAIYARISTANSNSGQSPEMQLRELREHAQRRGWEVSCEYVDEGISGAKDRRPALDRFELGKADGLARLMYVKGYIQGYADGDSAMEKISAVLMKNTPVDASTKKLIEPQAVRVADVTGFGKNENITVGKVDNAVSSGGVQAPPAPVIFSSSGTPR